MAAPSVSFISSSVMGRRWAAHSILPLLLTSAIGAVLAVTHVPTLYTLDSAEFVTAAYTLGLAHSPGYPLYLVLLHLFLQPFTAPDYAGNLFSLLALTAAVPFAYGAIVRLVRDPWGAAAATLITFWSYYVWVVGLFTEVYAPQIFTIALTAYALARLGTATTPSQRDRWALVSGAAFGLAVAMHPVSALFAPGVALILRGLARVSWRRCIIAGGLAIAIAVVPLVYFPLRYAAVDTLAINLAGTYNAQGDFETTPLNTVGGILWLLSGRQFDWLFFANTRTLAASLLETAGWFVQGFVGLGVVFGGIGLVQLRRRPAVLLAWLTLFLPYMLFFATYGAPDRALMMGPSHLLWGLPLAAGLVWLKDVLGRRWGHAALIALPLIILLVNFPRLNLGDYTLVRERAQAALDHLPPDTILFGAWTGITPVEYLHFIEGQRPDIRLYNLFLFQPEPLAAYVSTLTAAGATVIFLDAEAVNFIHAQDEAWESIRVIIRSQIAVPGDDVPILLYQVVPR